MDPVAILHIAIESPKKGFITHWITSDDSSQAQSIQCEVRPEEAVHMDTQA